MSEEVPYGHWRKLTPDGIDYRKCPKHNQWRKKGKCDMCMLEDDARRRAVEERKPKP